MSVKQLSAKELQADSIRMVKANRDKENADDVKFFNSDGFHSVYGHSCGYMDSFQIGKLEMTLGLVSNCYTLTLMIGGLHLGWSFSISELFSRNKAKHLFKYIRRVAIVEHTKGVRRLVEPRRKGESEEAIQYFRAITSGY